MTPPPPIRSSRPAPEQQPAIQPVEMRMILVAGADATAMREASMQVFRAGHVPVMVDWFEMPLDGTSRDVTPPLDERLLARCDAVLCVGGPSVDADALVGLGRSRGLRVFFSLKDALDG